MNMMQINSLFTLFSGETDLNKYSPLIDSAVSQVTSQLREGADISDTRLDYLCAAIANYRYSQIVWSKTRLPLLMQALLIQRAIRRWNMTLQRVL